MKNIRSRKGVTIMEVVIALVIITTISAVSLSMIVISHDVEAKAESAITAKNAAENAIECFQFAAGNRTVFWECLKKTADAYEFGKISFDEDGEFEATEDLGQASKARLVDNGCTIMITCINQYFRFSAKNAEGEDIIPSFEFSLGGAS